MFDSSKSRAANEAAYARRLAALVARPPLFFGLDDDLRDPDADDVAFHGRWVRKLMRALSPAPAPWELDADEE